MAKKSPNLLDHDNEEMNKLLRAAVEDKAPEMEIGEESKYSNLGVIKSVLRPLSHSHPALLHDKG